MSLVVAPRLNMTNIADPAARHEGRYQAALEMAEFADQGGFTAVTGEEHHLAATGWLPSPCCTTIPTKPGLVTAISS
jgi:alkanesulfonate monooxygenase SsuD/methylene tetrahydromethanopterin reductase-like flavin-dependent oxidoreductase (luciferase family)